LSQKTIENIQKNFINILVDLQKRTLDTLKPPGFPPVMGLGDLNKRPRASREDMKIGRKPTKKQLKALTKGRLILAEKHQEKVKGDIGIL